jgi:hypothetical protein
MRLGPFTWNEEHVLAFSGRVHGVGNLRGELQRVTDAALLDEFARRAPHQSALCRTSCCATIRHWLSVGQVMSWLKN